VLQTAQKLVLVAADRRLRDFMATVLIAEGYDTLTAPDAEAALKLVKTAEPSVVIVDSKLPDGEALALCRQLKLSDEQLGSKILLAGSGEAPALSLTGVDDFLSNPRNRSELLARVRLLARLKEYGEQLEDTEQVLFALARCVEARDRRTGDHCARLARMSVEIARELDLSEADCEALRKAGYLHDLGKVSVPDAILNKRGPLNDDEWAVVRTHPEVGERLCAPLKSLQDVLPIIRHHHERMNGTGYPDGLSGSEIPLTARVLQIADVYDALVSARAYKPALEPLEALSVMENEVQQGFWDRSLFELLREQIQRAAGIEVSVSR
jgi:putative two-component system response regulator